MSRENEKQMLALPERMTINNITPLFDKLKESGPNTPIELDFTQVKEFDTSAIALINYLKRRAVPITFKNVSPEHQKRLSMFPITTTPEEPAALEKSSRLRLRIEAIGQQFLDKMLQIREFTVLLTDEIFHTGQYLLKHRGVYPGEIANQLFFMGFKSFPIVALISFLIGVTIAITSAKQLHNFGADIYIADMVGYGMIRELVPLMTGIVLAGKIGAAITAEIASMKVLEETDALKTMAIIPEKFLMVPRLIAITLAIPLLVAIADFVGIFAGVLVARLVLNIPPAMFFTEMFTAVDLGDFLIGMLKTSVFGWLVVVSSGYKGFSVKWGAAGVGIATTQSVVLSISLIIIGDCIFALLLY